MTNNGGRTLARSGCGSDPSARPVRSRSGASRSPRERPDSRQQRRAAALAARARWLIVELKYAPELNDIEVVWPDLKAFNLASKMFTDADTLDAAIHTAIADLNTERNRDLLGGRRISA
jgi:hypothetical protein